jgi:hypothetical protein
MILPDRRRVRAMIALAVLGVAGCAPPPHPGAELSAGGREQRYLTALGAREARSVAVEQQLVIRSWIGEERRLPAVEAALELAAPDAFRLRVGSLLGTALDVAGRGDTVTARIPARRAWIVLPSVGDSIGVHDPGELIVKVWSAAWRPPSSAWRSAVWSDSLLRVVWLENGDSVALTVGTSGLPSWAEVSRPGRARVRASYREWSGADGAWWPARIELADSAGTFHIDSRIERARFPAASDPMRFTLVPPPEAERLGLADLRRALERLGSL